MNNNKIIELLVTKLPDFIVAIGIFIIFWIAGKIFKTMVKKILDERSPHADTSRVLAGIVKNLMVIIGFITALGTMGINISAIVVGLGLTGFAFGFAFKDMLSNFISGILIFIYEPFSLGDIIEVEGKKGKVIDINLRYVTIESENQNILVPNSISVSKIIIVER
jgi:small-conductance mechanosensitive channel